MTGALGPARPRARTEDGADGATTTLTRGPDPVASFSE